MAILSYLHNTVGILISIIVLSGMFLSAHSESTSPSIKYDVLKDTLHYTIRVNGKVWFTGLPTFLWSGGKRLSVEEGSLEIADTQDVAGYDVLGNWTGKEVRYRETGSKPTDVILVATIKQYGVSRNIIMFEQKFPKRVDGTNAGNPNRVSSGFPRFRVGGQQAGVKLGYLNFGGMFVGHTTEWIDSWDGNTANIRDGISGGPLVLFDKSGVAAILSPANNFMSASFSHEGVIGGNVSWGVMGGVKYIPQDHTQQTILYVSTEGINKAFEGWGSALRKMHGRTDAYVKTDFVVNYLGYWTDNGTYYYYNLPKKKKVPTATLR